MNDSLVPAAALTRRETYEHAVGLVLVFSIGAVGSAVTGLRLWKNVLLWRLNALNTLNERRMVELM